MYGSVLVSSPPRAARAQVWRGRGDPCDALYDMLRPRFDSMPITYQTQAANYHLGIHPLHPPHKLMRSLRAAAHARGGEEANLMRCREPRATA